MAGRSEEWFMRAGVKPWKQNSNNREEQPFIVNETKVPRGP